MEPKKKLKIFVPVETYKWVDIEIEVDNNFEIDENFILDELRDTKLKEEIIEAAYTQVNDNVNTWRVDDCGDCYIETDDEIV